MDKKTRQLKKLNVDFLTKDIHEEWNNFAIGNVNNHVVRLSVMQKDFHWHHHRNSDEFFYVVKGELLVDLEDRTEILAPGEMITIPKNIKHRTRAKERTIILCFESQDNNVKGDV